MGGSSRIPLVAALIAEQLRIVPTNLDQPETAVALGALHVPQEGTSLRTEALPEERTTHIAPPPRPAVVARPQGVAPVPAPLPHGRQMPVRQNRTFVPGQTPPYRPPARTRTRPWLIVGIVALFVAFVGGILLWQNSRRGGYEDALANPKNFPVDMSCESVIPMDQVSDAFGTEAKENPYAVEQGGGLDVDVRCAWSAVDSRSDGTTAELAVGKWYGATSKLGSDSFLFHGNDATREKIGKRASSRSLSSPTRHSRSTRGARETAPATWRTHSCGSPSTGCPTRDSGGSGHTGRARMAACC